MKTSTAFPRALGLAAALLLLAGVPSCASEAQFSVLYGADFPSSVHRTVSVFGVYKEGRLSSEAWDEILPRLDGALGRGPCPAAFGNASLGSSLAQSGAVDDYARASGPTDALIDPFGAQADGDLILLVTLSGRPPTSSRTAEMAPSSPTNTQAPISGYGARRGRGQLPGGQAPERGGSRDRSMFEVSASLFSVRLHHSVAVIAMNYSGGSANEAYKKFGEKLAAELPGLTCVGWKADAPVDEARIRAIQPSDTP